MNIDTIWEGIIIGAAGGSIAGISVWIISILREKVSERNHKQRIYDGLYNKTKEYQGYSKMPGSNDPRWQSTVNIANFNNLTVERVKYICSIHEKITLKVQKDLFRNELLEEKWAIKEFVR